MKSTIVMVVAFAALLAGPVVSPVRADDTTAPAVAAPPAEAIPALQEQIRALTQEITDLRARLQAPKPADSELAALLEKLQARIAELERQVGQHTPEAAGNGGTGASATAAELEEMNDRLEAVEKKAALDRLNFTGEVRVATDTLRGQQAAYFDGMALQKGVVDSMFYMQTNGGAFPMPASNDPASIYRVLAANVGAHYGDYLKFTNALTFTDLKGALATFPAAQQAALMGMLLPATYRAQQPYDNNIFYTTRVRLNMKVGINEHFEFGGRLAMYKAWGDSAGVQIFNGQPNSINMDGTTSSIPNSDIVRVDRAYFDWNKIGGSGLYFSVGRRPSTGGPPTEIREGRLRQGTPLGHVVDYQFDGVTVGYSLADKVPGAVYRFCYGLGYESGFGGADQLVSPANRLKDVHFGGFNLDLYGTDRMFVQATVLRAFNVTDGFNSLVVMPVDPVTGNATPGPALMRFGPSANLGDIDLAAAAMERSDGPAKWFLSLAGMKSHPNGETTPFGGLFSDPFSVPQSQTAWSVYTGLRYDLAGGNTQIGGEYNYGSKYWFNFTHAADEILLSKLATRGNVVELYLNQQFGKQTQLRISGINYWYQYSGSGWHLGEPKALDSPALLGFPTYKDAFNLRVALTVKF